MWVQVCVYKQTYTVCVNVYISTQVCVYSKQYTLYWQISVLFGTTFIKLIRCWPTSLSPSKVNATWKHELCLSYFSTAKSLLNAHHPPKLSSELGCNFRVLESISGGVSNPWLQFTTATEPTKHQYLSSPSLKRAALEGKCCQCFPKGKRNKHSVSYCSAAA